MQEMDTNKLFHDLNKPVSQLRMLVSLVSSELKQGDSQAGSLFAINICNTLKNQTTLAKCKLLPNLCHNNLKNHYSEQYDFICENLDNLNELIKNKSSYAIEFMEQVDKLAYEIECRNRKSSDLQQVVRSS
jgi:hypothetical protein